MVAEKCLFIIATAVTDDEIMSEIKKAKYFSIIVDSTPDLSHTDQLAIVCLLYTSRCV